MNAKAIGDYLRRLRVRSGYTQSDVGNMINVTSKAISRWESGSGMPEIGNLMVLSKLFGVTVDDILNCNESVFGGATESQASPDETAQVNAGTKQAEENAPADCNAAADNSSNINNTYNASNVSDKANVEAILAYMQANGYEMPKKKKQKSERDVKHSSNFLPMLFFAFLSLGGLVFSTGDYMITFTGIAISILAVGIAVITFLERKLPRKAFFITLIVLYSLVIFTLFLFCVLQVTNVTRYLNYSYYDNDTCDADVRAICINGCLILMSVLVMQLFYLISDFVMSKKASLALRIVAAVISLETVIYASVMLAIMWEYSDYSSYPVNMAMQAIIVGITLLVFAIAECTTHWVKLGTVACMIVGIVVPLTVPDYVEITETFVELSYEYRLPILYFVIGIIGPMLTVLVQVLENTDIKQGVTVWLKRSFAIVGVGCLIPLIVYTIDAFAADIMLDIGAFSIIPYALFMRLVIIAAAILTYFKYFRFDLFKKKNKEAVV